MMEIIKKALVITVGTGNVEDQEKTLVIPLKKSIMDGKFSKVVLLPSGKTIPTAKRIQSEIPEILMDIFPLGEGIEDDSDECFNHFCKVFSALIDEGFKVNDIVTDFTRGTKAMSAALVLASVSMDIPVLRYITGEKRDERGNVIPGTEILKQIYTRNATGHKQCEQAYNLFIKGNFAAVLEIMPETNNSFKTLLPECVIKTSEYARPLASFYLKWDRFDYKGALGESEKIISDTPEKKWAVFRADNDKIEWVRKLSENIDEIDFLARAERLKYLAADLIANGERRLEEKRYEDAYIRAYRALELIGQMRLFSIGMDSEKMDPENENVKKFIEKLQKEGSKIPGDKNGKYMFARDNVARFLKSCGDKFGESLIKLGKENIINARNKGILIHGYKATVPEDIGSLKDFYEKLKELIISDDKFKSVSFDTPCFTKDWK